MILVNLFDILSRTYIRNALIVGVIMALCLSLLGVSLVLKKHSMIGDGLSPVGFGAVAVAVAMSWAPLYFAIPVVIVASFFILFLAEKSKIIGDSAIALFSTISLAVGYAAIELGDGVSFNISAYLYGSILGVSKTEVIMSIIIGIFVISLFIILYNKIFSITFDETFTKSIGIKTTLINIIISILTSLTVVIGMKVMGALLITALIIFPVLSARQIAKTFKMVTILSAIIGVLSFIYGLIFACVFDNLPIGSSIVFASFIICILSFGIGFLIKKRIRIN